MRPFRQLRAFHRDEKGLEALQVILIVAVAAVVLTFLKIYWQDVKNWFIATVYPLFEFGKD